MSKSSCKSCAYYRQHYTFDKRRLFRVYCGHCTFSRAKKKAPDASIYENHLPSDSDESVFVTKEYLSKALLHYLLNLELLPEIDDLEQSDSSK